MSIAWRFSINGTQVEEPVGWDAIQFKLQRDDQFSGLENMLSESIVYDGTGGALIKAEYETDGIDAALVYLVEYSCDGITYVTRFEGILNCVSYKEVNGVVTVKAEPSGFHRKVKNRLDIPVNLMSSTSIGGEAMSAISPFDLGLHSKAFSLISEFVVIEPSAASSILGNSSAVIMNIPISPEISELPDTFQVDGAFAQPSAVPLNYYYKCGEALDDLTVEYRLKGSVTMIRIGVSTRDINFFRIFRRDNGVDTMIFNSGTITGISGNHTIDFDIPDTIAYGSVGVNEEYFYYASMDVDGGQWQCQLDMDDVDTFVTMTGISTYLPSSTKAFLLHEVFAIVSESITDIPDSFKSDFFGRINSSPRTYDINGCGGWVALTNGLNLRKMLDKDGNIFPVITSFNDLFESCNAVWNLGMRIEKDSDGKEFIRVEPKEYFYNLSSVITLSGVADIETVPAMDLLYNEFEVGYEKWNLNISKLNGIDEFNSKRNYSLPIEKAKKKLSAMSKIIASGYTIEQTRRIQYQDNATADFETDNDLFFICTNIDEVTTSLYTIPPASTTYAAGIVSERDENFTSIANLLSPETAYNLRISPARMAIKWWKTLASAAYYKSPATIKFISGTGNYQEQDQQTDICNTFNAVIEQNQNITSDNIIRTDADPLYIPNYINFQFPITWEQFLLLEANSEKALQFSCNGTIRRGFFKSLEFEPNVEGDTARFKLLEAGGCIAGEFDPDEFTIAFSIGEC